MAKKRKVSFEQRCQRELAWLLYITEGYIANVAHARKVNAHTLPRQGLALMSDALKGAETTARKIRAQLEKRKK